MAENKEREGASCMELHGDRLVLTSITIEEAPVLLPAFNGDEQFNQWSGHASGLTLDQVQADMLGTLNQPGGVVWHLADQTGALVGVAKTALLASPGTAWIDLLVIRQAFQGHGYGSEAASLLETHLFSSAGIRQIALAVLVQNTPAMAFWEKRGYARGGRYLDNEGDDVYAYLLSRPFASLEEDALVTSPRISLREG
jgi:RimJ/RimL family protein N-acetyltransferase